MYPGAVRPGWKPVSRTVEIDGAVPRWHSTGLYAPAGAPLRIALSKDAASRGLRLRVGTTADNLLAVEAPWRRAPVVSIEIPLDRPSLALSSPFGGLVYVVVPDGLDGWRGSVSGAIEAPWFRLGRDSPESFARQCAETHAPMGEIEGALFIATADTAQLRRVGDPAWIASFWDRAVEADRHLADMPSPRSPERICPDVQLSAGWLHNGYPLMYHAGSVPNGGLDWVLDRDALADCAARHPAPPPSLFP